jgi:hypothetical protein
MAQESNDSGDRASAEMAVAMKERAQSRGESVSIAKGEGGSTHEVVASWPAKPKEVPLHPSLFPGDKPPQFYLAGGPIKFLVSRYYFGFAVLFTCFACAGILFGWPNFSALLIEVGFFTSGCSASELAAQNCNSQQLALSGVFTTGSIVSFISPTLVGLFAGRFGPRNSMLLTTSIFVLGGIFGLAAALANSDGLIYAFAVCIGFSGQAMILPLYSYATMFPGNEGFALALLNGSFDASSLGFFIMRLLYESGVSFVTVMGAYLGAPVGLLALHAIFLWRSKSWEPLPSLTPVDASAKAELEAPEISVKSTSVKVKHAIDATGEAASSAVVAVQKPECDAAVAAAGGKDVEDAGTPTHRSIGSETATASSLTSGSRRTTDGDATIAEAAASAAALETVADDNKKATDIISSASPGAVSTAPADVAAAPESASGDLKLLPVSKQMVSVPYLLYAVWFAICMLSYTTFFSLLNPELDALGQVNGNVVSAFGIIAPLGCLFQFFVGPLIDRGGLKISFWIQWFALMAMNVCGLIQVLKVQYATMVFFAFFRALHFSNMVAFLARCFGYGTLSLTVGGVVLFGGLISLGQQGMLAWALSAAGFIPPRAFMVALAAVAAFWPIWLSFRDGKDGVLPRRRSKDSKAKA